MVEPCFVTADVISSEVVAYGFVGDIELHSELEETLTELAVSGREADFAGEVGAHGLEVSSLAAFDLLAVVFPYLHRRHRRGCLDQRSRQGLCVRVRHHTIR